MAISYSDALANAKLDALDTHVGTNGHLVIYDDAAAIPSAPDAALGGNNVLVEIPLNNPAFQAASSGSISLDTSGLTATATATGTANFFRINTSSGATAGVIQAPIADLGMSSTSISSGDTVTINSFEITEG